MEDFEQLLKQYKTKGKKFKDSDKEWQKLVESARVKGIIVLDSAKYDLIVEKRKERDEIYKELGKINDSILKLLDEAKHTPTVLGI